MTGTRISYGMVGTFLLAAVTLLAGCAPDVGVPEPTTTTPVEAEGGASATPTPTPTAEAVASCETLLDLTTLEAILTTGFDVNPVGDYITKIRNEGSPYALFDEYGGLVCPVNNGSRVSELYAYSPISADDQATQEARLVAEGYTASTVDDGTLYVHEPSEGIVFAYYFRNGFWWCGYDAGVIDMIVRNSPQS